MRKLLILAFIAMPMYAFANGCCWEDNGNNRVPNASTYISQSQCTGAGYVHWNPPGDPGQPGIMGACPTSNGGGSDPTGGSGGENNSEECMPPNVAQPMPQDVCSQVGGYMMNSRMCCFDPNSKGGIKGGRR